MKKHQFKFSNGYIVELQNITPNGYGQNVALRILKRKSWCDYYIGGSSGTASYSAIRQGYFAPPDSKNGYNAYKVLFETTIYGFEITKLIRTIKLCYVQLAHWKIGNGCEYIDLTGYQSQNIIWFVMDYEKFSLRISDKHNETIVDIDNFATTSEVLEFIEFIENLFNNKKDEKMKNEKDEIVIGDTKFKVDLEKITENEYRFNFYNRFITSDNGFYYTNAHLSTLSKADIKKLVQFFKSFIEDEKDEKPDAKLYELLEKLPAGWSISRGKSWGYDGDIYYLTSDTGKSFSLGDLSNLAKRAFLILSEYYGTIPFEELVGRQIKLKVHPASPLHNEIFYVLNYFVRTRHEDRTEITEKYINVSSSRTNQIQVISKKDYEDNYEVV